MEIHKPLEALPDEDEDEDDDDDEDLVGTPFG